MRFFSSKFFLLGVFLLLLISIPLTVFFIRRQQEVRIKAAPTTTLSLSPATKTVAVGANFDLDVMVNPEQNTVSFVKLHIVFDSTKLETVQLKENSTAFPLTLEGPDLTPGVIKVSLGIGSDPTKGIQINTKVATITFKSLASTAGPITVSFDPTGNQVLSLSTGDQPGENVLQSTSPASVSITGGEVSPTPTSLPSSPTPTSQANPTGTVTPTQATTQPTPTGGTGGTANAVPTCTSLTATPLTGSAPLLVSFTAKGSDSDGTIMKATFNFGDGILQDVTAPLGQKSSELKTSHTYQIVGTYSATVTFTDSNNGVSLACTQSIEVGTAGAAGPTPTPSAGGTPTIEAPGNTNVSFLLLIGVSILITLGTFFALF